MANNKVAPVFYSEQRSQHLPMEDGTVIDPKFIDSGSLISGDEGNLIVEGSDGGVRLAAEDLICDAGNCNNLIQTCEDGKLYVAPPVIVSEDAGNIVKEGSDGGAYLNVGDMVGGERDNQLELDDAGKFYVPPQNIVSKMDKNAIIEDRADGSAYLSAEMLLSKDDNALELGSDGGIRLDPAATDVQVVSKEDGNLIVEDRADKSAYLGFKDAVSSDSGNLIAKGDDGKLRLSAGDVVSASRGNLINTSDGGKLEVFGADLLSDVECNVLDIDRNGRIELCLDIKYNKITGEFELLGNDGKVIKSIQVPTAASVLVGAQLEKDPVGMDKGYYLKMSFKMADGSVEPVYVDVSALSDVYTGGKGINIHDYAVEVKLAPHKSGLSFDADGCLQADFVTLAGDGLQVEEDPTSLGYQFAVYCCDGLKLKDSLVTDVTTGERINKKYVGINLHPDEQILALSGDDGGCPYLSAYISLKVAGDTLVLRDRDGRNIGTGVKLGNGLSTAADGSIAVDLPEMNLALTAEIDADSDPDPNLRASKLHLRDASGADMCSPVPMTGGLRATNNGGLTIDPWESVIWNETGWTSSPADDAQRDNVLYHRPVSNRNLAQLVYAHNNAGADGGHFGHATSTNFGHVKLTDTPSAAGTADTGSGLSAAAGKGLADRIKALEDAPAAGGLSLANIAYCFVSEDRFSQPVFNLSAGVSTHDQFDGTYRHHFASFPGAGTYLRFVFERTSGRENSSRTYFDLVNGPATFEVANILENDISESGNGWRIYRDMLLIKLS